MNNTYRLSWREIETERDRDREGERGRDSKLRWGARDTCSDPPGLMNNTGIHTDYHRERQREKEGERGREI